ncbi:hypothetical protein WDQ77_001069 [Klebsiella variicola]
MKVKTYSVNTFDAWLQAEGDDTTGSYVKYEDYAALAAECAALKSAIEFAEPWLPTCDEELLHRIEIAKQTPATDRIVAGIKADGVEMFVEKCREKSMRAISSDIRNNWWLAGEHAEDFAAQLREGADK